MKEDTNQEKKEDYIEPFNIKIEDCNEFKKNKIPIFIKENNKYLLLDKGRFNLAELTNIKEEEYLIKNIVLTILFSIIFYLLLITTILTRRIMSLILCVIIYILGEIFQTTIIPILREYKSRLDFENIMNKILNSYAKLIFFNEKDKDKNRLVYPGRYVTDITGEINIPKSIKYVRIGGVQYIVEKDNYENFDKKYCSLFKKNIFLKEKYNTYHNIKLYYKDENFLIPKVSYDISSNSESYSIGFTIIFLSIILLQWVYALIHRKNNNKEIVIIYPAKLITKDDIQISNTNIIIHGQKLNNGQYITAPIGLEDLAKLEKDFAEYKKKKKEFKKRREKLKLEKQKKYEEKEKERIKKEEEERKKEEEERIKKEEEEKRIRDNTETLSRFGDNNYSIRVYRVYEKVYLNLYVYQENYEDNYSNKWYLGVRNINIKEDKKHIPEHNSYLYIPNGFDIKIQITHHEYKYVISIGELFTRSFRYYE